MVAARPLPRSTPETDEFWDGVAHHRLLLQRCADCAQPYFPPQPTCPRCGGGVVSSFAASGAATLYSFVVSHLSPPGFTPPYVLGVVQLEEGPRLLSPIVGVDLAAGQPALDDALEVAFEDVEGTTLYTFRRRSSS
jgi:uncharacterized OB-fold protein